VQLCTHTQNKEHGFCFCVLFIGLATANARVIFPLAQFDLGPRSARRRLYIYKCVCLLLLCRRFGARRNVNYTQFSSSQKSFDFVLIEEKNKTKYTQVYLVLFKKKLMETWCRWPFNYPSNLLTSCARLYS
jgi:hypothetical protein